MDETGTPSPAAREIAEYKAESLAYIEAAHEQELGSAERHDLLTESSVWANLALATAAGAQVEMVEQAQVMQRAYLGQLERANDLEAQKLALTATPTDTEESA